MKHLKFLLILACVIPAQCARILVLAPFFGKSHAIFINPIVLALSEKGHDVTLITSNVIKNAPSNIQQIDVSDINAVDVDVRKMFEMDKVPFFIQLNFIYKKMISSVDNYLASPQVQKLIKDETKQFDLVISELFFQESFYTFAYKYKAPIVLLGTSSHWQVTDRFMGNPSTLHYLPGEFGREFGDLNLLQRMTYYFNSAVLCFGNWIYAVPRHQEIMQTHFSNLPQPLPSVKELENNISLVLYNTYFSFDAVRPMVPGVVEVGGVHIKPPTKLPNDIQQFLDEAKDGAIYFSLGSNLRSAFLPKEKLDAIVKKFSTLKQRILWKWEDDDIPFNLPNVMFKKWMPQSDILAHPSIKAFVTQSGMLSTQEAVSRGVPMIGIPVYGDQHLNIAKIEHHGMAIKLPFSELDENTFSNAVDKIINDPSYMKTAKEMSARYNDRINKPLDTAVFWIEYVLRHRGAGFMKSKLVTLPWYQNYGMDIYAVLALFLIVDFYILKYVCKCICKKKNKEAAPKKKRQ